MALDIGTPVLILGGKENSLSIARHLGGLGIPVRVSGRPSAWGLYSRHCKEALRIPRDIGMAEYWRKLLLGPDGGRFAGSVLIPCCDEALVFVAENIDALKERFLIGDFAGAQMRDMLDKQKTLEMARASGVETPAFWKVASLADLEPVLRDARFPLIVKPKMSHRFAKAFGQKFFHIEASAEELREKLSLAIENGFEVMVVEMIPGPDSLLSSHYTYVTGDGRMLFEFTKRVLRRYPVNSGNACYHITEWLPETAAAGRRFFEGVGYRGLGNIEFKRDPRDGKLKIIEVNGRFTAAQELLRSAGAPIDLIVYCHITGQAPPQFSDYEQQLRFWYPLRDFLSFLDHRGRGELSLLAWIKSILPFKKIYPLFRASDPAPSVGALAAMIEQILMGRV
jgi:D-aspartate ligase